MGAPMAARLLAAGHRVAVCDAVTAAVAPLAAAGAEACATPAEVAARARVVVTSLPGPLEVEAVVNGPDGLLARDSAGLLIVETSTIGPAQSRALASRAASLGAAFVDAPVSGGVAAARAGTLTAMVGGAPDDVARALVVLRAFATHVRHLGPSGSGSVAKAINQSIFLSYVAAYCEAVACGRRAGLDVGALLAVLRTSVAGNPRGSGWDEHIDAHDLVPGFAVARVLKDVEVAAEAARDAGAETPLLASAIASFRALAGAGYGELDMTALYALRAGLASALDEAASAVRAAGETTLKASDER